MNTLTIDRADWLTGAALRALNGALHPAGTLCHEKSRQKCCLGIYGAQLGISEERMQGLSMLSGLGWDEIPGWLHTPLSVPDQKRFKRLGSDVIVESVLADINDGNYHPSRKEAAIKYLFKKYGDIDVKFVGRYADGTARAKRALKEAK